MNDESLFLDPEDIRYLHDNQIEEFSGYYGENEPGLIDYMAEKPFLTLFGVEQYPTVFLKAAVYIDGFAKHQYFCDGNKRTGIKCALTFLAIRGYQLTVSDLKLFKFTTKIAESADSSNDLVEITLEEIADWLEENSIINLSYL